MARLNFERKAVARRLTREHRMNVARAKRSEPRATVPVFNEFLKEVVAHTDMTQSEIAKRAGIGDRSLHLYWNGKSTPGLNALVCLLEVFGYELKIVKKGQGDDN